MEKEQLKLELIKLASYCSTCRKDNANEWMLGLCSYLNAVFKKLGEKDYLEYDGYGLMLIKKGENDV